MIYICKECGKKSKADSLDEIFKLNKLCGDCNHKTLHRDYKKTTKIKKKVVEKVMTEDEIISTNGSKCFISLGDVGKREILRYDDARVKEAAPWLDEALKNKYSYRNFKAITFVGDVKLVISYYGAMCYTLTNKERSLLLNFVYPLTDTSSKLQLEAFYISKNDITVHHAKYVLDKINEHYSSI